MSEPLNQPTLRIVPDDPAEETSAVIPTPEQEIIQHDPQHPPPPTRQPGDEPIIINEAKPDTDDLLTEVLEGKHVYSWPAGAVVGDGTPGPGRRPIDVDERIVRAMAMVGGTYDEIGEFFGCSGTVIRKRFGDIVRGARAGRKLRLRQAQYQTALAGNVTMQIWLGKNELGQRDEGRQPLGDLSRFSDEELAQIAQGKVPGLLGAGKKEDEDEK
jgi:hypothetical protein